MPWPWWDPIMSFFYIYSRVGHTFFFKIYFRENIGYLKLPCCLNLLIDRIFMHEFWFTWTAPREYPTASMWRLNYTSGTKVNDSNISVKYLNITRLVKMIIIARLIKNVKIINASRKKRYSREGIYIQSKILALSNLYQSCLIDFNFLLALSNWLQHSTSLV